MGQWRTFDKIKINHVLRGSILETQFLSGYRESPCHPTEGRDLLIIGGNETIPIDLPECITKVNRRVSPGKLNYLSKLILNFVKNKSFNVMNAAEIKLDMFRKIDSLKESDLEKIYNKFIALLSTTSLHKLSKDEDAAIYEALEAGKVGQSYTSEEVMKEARQKYPNLNFK